MISLTDTAKSVITGTHLRYLQVQSWLGDQLLAEDVPCQSGMEENDRTLNIPERVTFTVPRRDRGTVWAPTSDDHPLATNGQRLVVRLGIGTGMAEPEWIQRGVFLVQDAEPEGDAVSVTAVGLLTLIKEARLVSPYQPTGTLLSALRGLLEPALTITLDGALVDRAVPTGSVNFDDDRLANAWQLIAAWPADASVDPFGFLHLFPVVVPTVAVAAFTDGQGGTAVSVDGGGTRDGAANAFVARGTASDGSQVQAVEYLLDGPKRYPGPFNPLPVPTYLESPLLTTVGQCAAAAATMRDKARLDTGRTFTFDALPHVGLQPNDPISVTTDEVGQLLCTVQSVRLPYLAGDGLMSVTAVSV